MTSFQHSHPMMAVMSSVYSRCADVPVDGLKLKVGPYPCWETLDGLAAVVEDERTLATNPEELKLVLKETSPFTKVRPSFRVSHSFSRFLAISCTGRAGKCVCCLGCN